MNGVSVSLERLTYGAILDAHRVKARMPYWRGRFDSTGAPGDRHVPGAGSAEVSDRSTITPRFRRVIDTLGEAAD
jgi:hypothetical protein